MVLIDNISIEECPKIVPFKVRLSIIQLQKKILIETNSKDYSKQEIEELVISCNEGLIFRRKVFNVIAKVPETNEIVGIASASYSGIILSAFVHPHHQRQGIGKAMILKLEQLLIQKSVDYIWLMSSVTAQAFFKEMGYKTILKAKNSKGLAIRIMSKKISKDFSFKVFIKELMIFSYYWFGSIIASGKSMIPY